MNHKVYLITFDDDFGELKSLVATFNSEMLARTFIRTWPVLKPKQEFAYYNNNSYVDPDTYLR